MIKLKQAVIVEGKYDKIKLSNFLDAFIVTTDGFRIFSDKEKRQFIRLLAEKQGIIVITDSDNAGKVIRGHIKNIVGNSPVTNVYLPQIKGKERRKTKESAQGYLGLEGLSQEIIVTALERSGILGEENLCKSSITKADLFSLGLTGCADSSKKRKLLYKKMGLPDNLTANNFLEYINRTETLPSLERLCKECLQEADKK